MSPILPVDATKKVSVSITVQYLLIINSILVNILGCKNRVEIVGSSRGPPFLAQPHIFTSYSKQAESFNGRAWYKSTDGTRIIAFYGSYWLVQPTSDKYN